MTWKEFVYHLVVEFCNERGKRTFTLQEFYSAYENDFKQFKPKKRYLLPKVRQQLQFLRDDGLIQFLDGRGTYTLKGVELLKGEVEDEKVQEISIQAPEKREYLIETYQETEDGLRKQKKSLAYIVYIQCAQIPLTSLIMNHILKCIILYPFAMVEKTQSGIWL